VTIADLAILSRPVVYLIPFVIPSIRIRAYLMKVTSRNASCALHFLSTFVL